MLAPIGNNILYGHDKIICSLSSAVRDNKLHHALLFLGPQGIGKATLGYQFAKFLFLKSKYQDKIEISSDFHETLRHHSDDAIVKQVENFSYPDLMVLQDSVTSNLEVKKNKGILIDEVRLATRFLQNTSISDSYRILIIDSIDYTTHSALNALLKTLEEPGEKTVIILICSSTKNIPATIISRCRTIKFTRPDYSDYCKIINTIPKPSYATYELLNGNASLGHHAQGDLHDFVDKISNITTMQELCQIIDLIKTDERVFGIAKCSIMSAFAKKNKDIALSKHCNRELLYNGITDFNKIQKILSNAEQTYIDKTNVVISILCYLNKHLLM